MREVKRILYILSIYKYVKLSEYIYIYIIIIIIIIIRLKIF